MHFDSLAFGMFGKQAFKKEEQYTPLCTYFNPLDLDMNIETLMPYFVNYSTDWAKWD